tara:strand:- start:631 stop:909 length:279 start_codon:yes stop_codon:yes gene_type:complete
MYIPTPNSVINIMSKRISEIKIKNLTFFQKFLSVETILQYGRRGMKVGKKIRNVNNRIDCMSKLILFKKQNITIIKKLMIIENNAVLISDFS